MLESFPPGRPVLCDGSNEFDATALAQRVSGLCAAFQARRAPLAPVAILADNSPEWLAADLATQELGLTLVPLPLFFTPAQWAHVLRESGASAVLAPAGASLGALGFGEPIQSGGPLLLYQAADSPHQRGLADTQKITFTSGTTAAPKGVCLSTAQQWELARALKQGVAQLHLERHLCLLPFAVLLENISGPYTAMLSGATTICPPLAEVGMAGASQFDPQRCLDAIARYQAQSIIVLPQMLQAILGALAPDDSRTASLRFIAVGGAKVPARLLAAAHARGLPVFEGYGLSECCSVVALNLPGSERNGSVGKPLPHRPVRIAADGEIEVGGALAHYLGMAPNHAGWLATGDLGHLDPDGYLYIDGRKKDILITSFGRNVSPEWPEAALLGTGLLAQALVIGDGRPWLSALLVPARPELTSAQIQQAVDLANQELPDYAQIRRWTSVPPFTPQNGQATPNGRPRRAAIQQQLAGLINSMYDHQEQTA
ncbi:AMP-binding protein [Pseudoduganella sp. OTU4001]|uniref:AMP-binding protein n=1 Tax=Pseudoduganella sp. OTU4001 TaxID=3043854 RepID=UPI00313E2EB2